MMRLDSMIFVTFDESINSPVVSVARWLTGCHFCLDHEAAVTFVQPGGLQRSKNAEARDPCFVERQMRKKMVCYIAKCNASSTEKRRARQRQCVDGGMRQFEAPGAVRDC